MRVAIVQPPRLYWAFINDYDNFMVPQAPPALAAVARAAGHEVTILDCLPMKLGWKSLEARLRELRPDVVAAGENHAVYSHEVVKLMGLVKSIDRAHSHRRRRHALRLPRLLVSWRQARCAGHRLHRARRRRGDVPHAAGRA